MPISGWHRAASGGASPLFPHPEHTLRALCYSLIEKPKNLLAASGLASASTRLSNFPLRLPLRTAALGHKVNVVELIEDGSRIRQYM